jgi:hypothetical protein
VAESLNAGKYIKAIQNLPGKDSFERSDLLINDLLIKNEKNLSVYYAPFDYINRDAKVIIIGITPGFTQMNIAIKYAKESLTMGRSYNNILKHIKENAAFAGQMKINLISMLNELELNKLLNIRSCDLLFQKEYIGLSHMTSIIRYPVFNKGKDYTGHSPDILKSNMLKDIINGIFVDELRSIKCSIIIPLGSAASKVLKFISHEYYEISGKCLFYFPHPSGANAHRIKTFYQKKNEYKEKIKMILK